MIKLRVKMFFEQLLYVTRVPENKPYDGETIRPNIVALWNTVNNATRGTDRSRDSIF